MESDDFIVAQPDDEETRQNTDHGRNELWFFIGHRPQSLPEIDIGAIRIDDIDLWPIRRSELPGKQGMQVHLGSFESGRTLQLKWHFRTGHLSQPIDALIGVYRNNLNHRTVLERLTIDTFQTHDGSATIETSAALAGSVPGVFIERTGVHQQCYPGVASVMLRNQSVTKYRINVLKQREYDEKIPYVLIPGESAWIGCADDRYTYSISDLVKL